MPPSPKSLSSKPKLKPFQSKPPPALISKSLIKNVTFTEQQRLFIKEWAGGESIKSAAVRAGYLDNGSYAYQVLVKNPEVIAQYQAIKAKFEQSANMSREKVMGMLQESYDMAKTLAEPASMVAAVREIGKMCGYYAPVEKKITIEGNLALDKMNRLSDQELLELVHGAGEQITAAVQQLEMEDDDDDAQALEQSAGRHTQAPDDSAGEA